MGPTQVACRDATDVIVHWDPAIGVELAERDVERPVAIAEMPQRVGGKIEKLADAHSGAAQQKQGIGEPSSLRSWFSRRWSSSGYSGFGR